MVPSTETQPGHVLVKQPPPTEIDTGFLAGFGWLGDRLCGLLMGFEP
jgi:hypothetical protein